MSQKIDRDFVKTKIVTLFEYRKFPFLFDQIKLPYDQKLMSLLEDLQFNIYKLDHHLESIWDIEVSDLDPYWRLIYNDLDRIDIPRDKHHDFCKHIYKYQNHELQLREEIYPDRFKLGYFYYYKSCDVKLIRRIIYRKYPQIKNFASEGQWRLFDYVTEVNDDIEDLYEDCDHYNANPFMIGILRNGLEYTFDLYKKFLADIKDDLNSIQNTLLRNWTAEVLDQTSELLINRIENTSVERLKTKLNIKPKQASKLIMA